MPSNSHSNPNQFFFSSNVFSSISFPREAFQELKEQVDQFVDGAIRAYGKTGVYGTKMTKTKVAATKTTKTSKATAATKKRRGKAAPPPPEDEDDEDEDDE